jgi:gluconokinase
MTPDKPVVLALDIGSSSTRAIPFDARAVAHTDVVATRTHTVSVAPDGSATLDADALVEGAVECIGETLAKLGRESASLRAVGVSIFMHSWVGVDADGRPTTPVVMWSDTRSGAAVAQLRREFGDDRFHATTGCPPHTSYAPPKFLWLRRHEPDTVRRTRLWMNIGDYALYRLFGRAGSSRSLASSLALLDARTGDWSREVFDYLGLPLDAVPPLVAHDDAFVGVSDAWRDRLGVAGRIPWFPANGDGSCSNVGSGGVDASTYALNLGTSGAIRVLDRHLVRSAPKGLWCYLTNDNRPFLGGAITNAGNLFAWLCERLSLEPGDALDARIGALEPDAHGLTLLPFLMGERAVGWQGDATAAIVGLRASTSNLEILRAGLETVAIRLALILERLRAVSPMTNRMVAGGGVLRSPSWMRIVTDALGMPVYESAELEASARGAAIFALYALGAILDLDAIPAALGAFHEPNPAATARYADARERHLELYRKLVGDFV